MEGRILHDNIRQGLSQEATNELDVPPWAGIWQIQSDEGLALVEKHQWVSTKGTNQADARSRGGAIGWI